MDWKSRDVVPPPATRPRARMSPVYGHSIAMLFKHKSGRVSFGKAIVSRLGVVTNWYPGEFGDNVMVAEAKDDKDPIVQWTECPAPAEIVEAVGRMEGHAS